jgi:hypothetical protein
MCEVLYSTGCCCCFILGSACYILAGKVYARYALRIHFVRCVPVICINFPVSTFPRKHYVVASHTQKTETIC